MKRWFVAVLALALLLVVDLVRAAEEPKRVLMLTEYKPDSPTNIARERIFRDTFNAAMGYVDYYSEYIDAPTFSDRDYRLTLRDYLSRKYAKKRFDVVVTVGSLALEFMRTFGVQLFPGAPVVSSNTDRELIEKRTPGLPVTGVARRLDPKGTLDLILMLQPNTTQVVLVGGHVNAAALESLTRRELREYEGRLAFTYLMGLPIEELLARVSKLPERTAIMHLTMHDDGNGRRFLPTEALARITKAANVPVYGLVANYVNHGIVGGSLHDTDSLARETAEMTVRLLRGESIANIPVRDGDSLVTMANWLQLRRWGLSESRLPPGTVVLNKEPSLWDRYRWLTVTVLFLFVAQATTIAGLFVQRTRRREMEQRNTAILRAMPDLMFVHDRAGTILDYYAADRDELYSPPEQFLGKQIPDVLPPGVAAAILRGAEQAAAIPQPVSVEYELPMSGGTRFCEARMVDLKPDKVLTIVRNVTDRKRAESALEDSRRFTRRIAETIPNVIFLYDVMERRSVYVNDRSTAVLGYTAEEVVDMGDQFLARTMHPDDLSGLPRLAAAYAHAKDDEILEHVFRFRHKNGEWRWIHRYVAVFTRTADGRVKEILGTATDITALKTTEQALQASQERYALATVAGNVGIWDWNIDTEEIYGDLSLKAVLGYQDGGIGHRLEEWSALVHPGDLEDVKSRIRAHFKGETPMYENEHRIVRKDGSIRWCLTRGSVTERMGSRAARMTGTCTDVTARKQAEEALHHANAELARLHRITTLSEVSAALTHEINQPLTAIVSNATTCLRLLAMTRPDIGEVLDALRDVVQDGKRASDIILRTRQVFARHQGQKTSVNVNELIRDSCILAHHRLQSAHILLRIYLAKDLPLVRGDQVELQQVMWNLMTNAFDAMDGMPPTSRVLTIRSSVEDGAIQVAIQDTGQGFGEADVTRMFEPFFTTKPEGMGMGLSISRTIVEAHGGRLWAGQNTSQGAEFCFSLPAVAAHEAVVGEAAPSPLMPLPESPGARPTQPL